MTKMDDDDKTRLEQAQRVLEQHSKLLGPELTQVMVFQACKAVLGPPKRGAEHLELTVDKIEAAWRRQLPGLSMEQFCERVNEIGLELGIGKPRLLQ